MSGLQFLSGGGGGASATAAAIAVLIGSGVVVSNGANLSVDTSSTVGQVLGVTGANTFAFGALNLALAAAVTGILPVGNQANQVMAGDVTGTTGASVVANINGSTVPAGGALTTGNGLHVTGAGALSYSALNLAGGANYVTGVLPSANQAAQTMGGDVTGTTAVSVVAALTGTTNVVTVADATNFNKTGGNTYGFNVGGVVTATIGSTYLTLGPLSGAGGASTVGAVRVTKNQVVIAARNSGDSADIPLLETVVTSNNLIVGNTAVGAMVYRCSTGGTHILQENNTTVCTITSGSFQLPSAAGVVGSTGSIRLGKAISIVSRINGTGDMTLLTTDTNDLLTIGSISVANQTFNIATSGVYTFQVNSAQSVTLGSSSVSIGVIGSAGASVTALSGQFRGGGAGLNILVGRNNAGTADITVASLTTGNVLIVGADTAGGTKATSVAINPSGGINFNGTSNSSSVNLAGATWLWGETLASPQFTHTVRTTDAATTNTTIRAQGAFQTASAATNVNGAAVLIQGGVQNVLGSNTGLRLGVRIELSSANVTMVEATEPAVGRRNLCLVRGSAITTTEMPVNTGDLVVFVGNAATAPTAAPVSGGILYATGGKLGWYTSSNHSIVWPATIAATPVGGGAVALPALLTTYVDVTIDGTAYRLLAA